MCCPLVLAQLLYFRGQKQGSEQRKFRDGLEMIQRRQEILEEEIILIDIRTRELQTKYRCLNTETIGAQERRLMSEVQIGVM